MEVSGVDPPLYLRNPDPHYWFEYLQDAGVLYFQYNRASEMAGEGVAELGERLLAELEARDVDAFVLDLRFNTGGSVGPAQDLMVELQEQTQGMSS